MKTIFNILDNHSPLFIGGMSFLSSLSIAIIDIATCNTVSLVPLYVIPVLFVSWYGTKRAGVVLAVVCTIIWATTQRIIYFQNFSIGSTIYDGALLFLSYSILAVLITNFRHVYREETIAADTDNLTQLLNQRGFYAEFANEWLRSVRYKHIFSLAYIDIDNFKIVNDTLGHSIGDELLIETSKCLKLTLRKTDTIARVGGDEFVCLLPETQPEAARNTFIKVREMLQKRMDKYNWNVSFSIGMVTFKVLPDDIKEAILIADDLMYSVKNYKKDNIAYKIWYGNVRS